MNRESLASSYTQSALSGRFVANAGFGQAETAARGEGLWRRSLLTFRVQADAFSVDPAAYLQAIVWRLRGLRLRSRNCLSALAGRSPNAYALWIARDEPALSASQNFSLAHRGCRIIPVIDCLDSAVGLEATLDSLGQAGASSPIILSRTSVSGILNVAEPDDLSDFISSSDVWLCPIKAGDCLAPRALETYAGAASCAGGARIIYSDDDLLSSSGIRRAPHFKPVWNPELFESHDFITGAAIVRVSGADLTGLDPSRWSEQLVSNALNSGDAPIHLPVVLHHRRARPKPNVPAKPQDLMPIPAPLVTVIIPTKNHVGLLRKCLDGVRATDYPRMQIIIVDNGSDDPETIDFLEKAEAEWATVIRIPGPFNYSALNNAAVEYAKGDFLCFLNNDVEITDPDWLSLMVRQARRPEFGAIGARLLYADLTVQHAGVYIGIGGGAGHAHRFLRHDEVGYFERARLPQRVSAVTGACIVVERGKFLAVGGFDEVDFPVAFNDVDLCLKLNLCGWQSFYEPRATLIHHESRSRGSDAARANRTRFASELAALKRKWRTDEQYDPYHHPQLSRFCEQFLISV